MVLYEFARAEHGRNADRGRCLVALAAHDRGIEHSAHALQDTSGCLTSRIPDRLQNVDHLGRCNFGDGALADRREYIVSHSRTPLRLVLLVGELLLLHLEVALKGGAEGSPT